MSFLAVGSQIQSNMQESTHGLSTQGLSTVEIQNVFLKQVCDRGEFDKLRFFSVI